MKKVTLNPDFFRYELTAFLSALRSVTFIMQKEFSKEVGFEEWYKEKQGLMKNDAVLKYLHRQRTLTHHIYPILQYPIGITEQISEGKRVNAVLTGTGGSLVHSTYLTYPRLKPIGEVKYYFEEIKEKDVIEICQEGLNILNKIVEECEIKFKGKHSQGFEFI